MEKILANDYSIDYIEIYTPMAKALAYWHRKALGFQLVAYADHETGQLGSASYVLLSGQITLVLTSAYPIGQVSMNNEIYSFIAQNYCGVKRIVLRVDSVTEAFDLAIDKGAFPIKYPARLEDRSGFIEEAAIRLYDHSEIMFISRNSYGGIFKPGYKSALIGSEPCNALFTSVDHIASEVRINESTFWTNYLTNVLGTSLVQSIEPGIDNRTGMILKINQSGNKELTLVIAEPESTHLKESKVQKNIDKFGSGIHHLAFTTIDLIQTTRELMAKDVEFVSFPDSYYKLLREDPELKGIDIDVLHNAGILIDKEDNTFLLQKFLKPISDRPFFIYEIVQRINGYDGFALKNINILKKAEESEIMKASA